MRHHQPAPFKNGVFLRIVAVVLIASFGHTQVFAKDAQSYVDSAQTYVQKGNLRAAEVELRNAVREAPKDAHIHALLAQVYLGLGEFRSAERQALSARDHNGDETDYLLTLADAMLRQDKWADVLRQIKV